MWNNALKYTCAFIVDKLKLNAPFQQNSGDLCGTVNANHLVKTTDTAASSAFHSMTDHHMMGLLLHSTTKLIPHINRHHHHQHHIFFITKLTNAKKRPTSICGTTNTI